MKINFQKIAVFGRAGSKLIFSGGVPPVIDKGIFIIGKFDLFFYICSSLN